MKATTLGLSALLLTSACTDELADRTAETGRAIAFTPAAETRAAVDNADGMAGGFNVWGWYGNTDENTDKNVFDGVIVKKGTDGWGYDGTQYWIPGMKYNFYGVYPANVGECTDKGIITVSNFDCSKTGDAAVDLMTATAKGDGDSPAPVAMEFKHELARVKFTVKSENTVATISSFKVYGVNYQGTLTKGQTTTWDPVTSCTEANTPYKLEKFTFNTTNGFEKDMLGDVLLIPDTDLTDAKLYIAYKYQGDTVDRTSTIDLQTTAITQWDAGKSYHYTLTIKGGTLTVTVKVADWKEEDTSVSWG